MLPIALIFLSGFTGLVLFISFPPYGSYFLAWIAFVPLFSQIALLSPGKSFLALLLCGMVFFIGIFQWIFEVQGYTLLHHALLAVYLGAYFAVFGLSFAYISKRLSPIYALAAAPFLWAALEYIRSNFFFLALPWGLLAHSQYRHPLFLQTASITGVYGVSFLIIMLNSVLAALMLFILSKTKQFHGTYANLISRHQTFALAMTTFLATCIALVYGSCVINKPFGGEPIKLSLVQANIPQEKKWDPQYARQIVQTHADLTRVASTNKPGFIVWPETATPRSVNRDPNLSTRIGKLVEAVESPLLIGSSQTMKFKQQKSKTVKYKNSALLIHPRISNLKNQQYDKVRLMPFGEYLPHEGRIPWSMINVSGINSYLPGEELTIFQIPEARFGVTICWENLFPDLVRQFVKNGAQFIVNITNEAWFGDTAAPHQFLSMSVFRAVENGVWVARCANTGISCFIDPNGRIVKRVVDDNGKDTFVQGVITHAINPVDAHTFYTKHGDVFAWVCVLVSVAFIVWSLIVGKSLPQNIPTSKKETLD